MIINLLFFHIQNVWISKRINVRGNFFCVINIQFYTQTFHTLLHSNLLWYRNFNISSLSWWILKKGVSDDFRTKKLYVKCWWNWHLDIRFFLLWSPTCKKGVFFLPSETIKWLLSFVPFDRLYFLCLLLWKEQTNM